MSATTRIQGGASGGPMNGMFPSQVAARSGMQQFNRKRLLPGGRPTDIGGMTPGGPQPAGQMPSFMGTVMSPGGPVPQAPLTQTVNDSFLNGKTQLVNTNPGDTANLRGQAAGNLTGRVGSDQSGYTPQIDSVDSLGGVNSPFFQHMMMQLQPAFDQRRASSLAAAKESAGNLTGSGFANTLGTAANRSLGDEQATMADYASRGIGQELARQTSLAGFGNDTANRNADRYTQLLGMFGNSGVGPAQLTHENGAGTLLGPAASIFGQWLANRGRGGTPSGGGGTPNGSVPGDGLDAGGDWASSIGGGASTGATIGSIIPGVGTGIGAAVGGAIGGLKKIFHW